MTTCHCVFVGGPRDGTEIETEPMPVLKTVDIGQVSTYRRPPLSECTATMVGDLYRVPYTYDPEATEPSNVIDAFPFFEAT